MKKLATTLIFAAALTLTANTAFAGPAAAQNAQIRSNPQPQAALLLPAVQSARESARRNQRAPANGQRSAGPGGGPHVRVFDGQTSAAASPARGRNHPRR